MNKNIIAIMFLLLMPVALSDENYLHIGGNTILNDFNLGQNIFIPFNEADSVTGSQSLAAPFYHPYSAYLNNDGTNEIIVFDGDNMRLYPGTSLPTIDSLTLQSSHYGAPYIYDFGSGNRVIIPYLNRSNSNNISIVSWDGSAFSSFGISVPTASSSVRAWDGMVSCNSEDECLAVYEEKTSTGTGQTFIMAFSFDDTGYQHKNATLRISVSGIPSCLNGYHSMPNDDVDGDGESEFIITGIEQLTGGTGAGQGQGTYVYRVSINDSGWDVIHEDTITFAYSGGRLTGWDSNG